jgi:hypothetical protein
MSGGYVDPFVCGLTLRARKRITYRTISGQYPLKGILHLRKASLNGFLGFHLYAKPRSREGISERTLRLQ